MNQPKRMLYRKKQEVYRAVLKAMVEATEDPTLKPEQVQVFRTVCWYGEIGIEAAQRVCVQQLAKAITRCIISGPSTVQVFKRRFITGSYVQPRLPIPDHEHYKITLKVLACRIDRGDTSNQTIGLVYYVNWSIYNAIQNKHLMVR